ncbi:protein FLUORESCENT IN BLUE LIGHT, chloroplastic-like [Macadamia integrifolia]|uniref:protein FLUORESCENT IN BLUE LIGHT, chloroplastic-like n=1 Tax=Macadamia integrifolia TaxID=60698 RepID=UPI001C4EBCA2|nr:protein FLUORESCENT IN BLUE LIGHT, chloroplastic-like [Macadamia integrifolia]
MAVVVRCCCLSPRPIPGGAYWHSGLSPAQNHARANASEKLGARDIVHFGGENIFKHVLEIKALLKSEKLGFLSSSGEKFMSSFSNSSSRNQILFEASQLLSTCQYIYSWADGSQMSKFEGTRCIGKKRLPDYDHGTVECLFHNQSMLRFRLPTSAYVLSIVLMSTIPFKALAETCENENSVFNMPLLLSVALIGATVGGLLARQRKGELKRLNDQLRQINAALRRQAKIESYAPSLSYAPVASRIPDTEVIVDSRKEELISRLKTGKNFLRNQNPEKSFLEFKAALELAQNMKDPIEEKKAARGLGASLQRQGKYREAIRYHSMVLAISEREGEDSGDTEAYGAIADCYTELGDLEQAGKFYDKYIARLEVD